MDQLGSALKLVCISDTHTKHEQLKLPVGDILIHAGDFTLSGETKEVESFADWLEKQPFKHKIVIAGNHDVTMDEEAYNQHLRQKFHRHLKTPINTSALKDRIKKSCTYLENSSVEVEGYKFWGSPYSAEFCDWGFQLKRGNESAALYSSIPTDTDIVITHGPPNKVLDKVAHGGENVGCVDLYREITQRVKPIYHIFGHIHEQHGIVTQGSITFINAASCTLRYRPENPPIVVTLPRRIQISSEELTKN